MISEYYIHLLILCLLYAIVAQSFNLSFGRGRLFNLAHVASYAIGAYSVGLLTTDYFDFLQPYLGDVNILGEATGFFILFSVFIGLVIGAFLAYLLGLISFRLTSDYFAIGSIAYSAVIAALLTNWKELTHGVLGIPGIPRPNLFGYSLQENVSFLLVLSIVCIFTQLFYFIVMHNGFSRALSSQAENEYAASSIGINPSTEKVRAFLLSTCGATIGGAVYALYINYVDPTSFSLSEMIFILTIVVVGKPGSFWGVLAATIFLVLLPEPISQISWINDRPDILGPTRQLLYAGTLAALVYLRRRSLFPLPREV